MKALMTSSGSMKKCPGDPKKFLKIVHLSDTHGKVKKQLVPKGDIFIFSGDFTHDGWKFDSKGKVQKIPNALYKFDDFLGGLDDGHGFKYKFVVPGNHDFLDTFSPDYVQKKLLKNCTYLCDNSFTIDLAKDFPEKILDKQSKRGVVKIYGSPWSHKEFGAFGTEDRESKWEDIPEDTDILVTHVPPQFIRDLAFDKGAKKGVYCDFCGDKHPSQRHWGCEYLRKRVYTLHKGHNLRLHCFGHVHKKYGITKVEEMVFTNGSNESMMRDALCYYFPL